MTSGTHVQRADKKDNKPNKKALRQQALLEGATELFNARGISGTSIAQIAKQLGLARASLYHYVDDRSDLVYQCYQRSCDITAYDLDIAEQASCGIDRTFEYIRQALNPQRASIAVLSEIRSLNDKHRHAIQTANHDNTRRVAEFIEQGIADGSIRDCDAEIASQAIVGILAWSQLLPHWSKRPNTERLRERALDAMLLILDRGVAVEHNYRFACSQSVEQFIPRLENAFDRAQASAVKIDLFLARASKLFNQAGIESTSIDSVAESLGVTKGAMYHHFNDKTELITRCYARSFELYEKFVDLANDLGSDGLSASLINSHLNIQAQVGALSPLMPQPGFDSVPANQRHRFRKLAATQNRSLADFLRLGIEQRCVAPCDANIVTHICAGAFGWIPKWLPPNQASQGHTVANKMCDILANGLSNS